MSTLDARLSRLEAHYLAQWSAPGLTDAEGDAPVERMRATITQVWEGMTERERQEAEHLPQTEIRYCHVNFGRTWWVGKSVSSRP